MRICGLKKSTHTHVAPTERERNKERVRRGGKVADRFTFDDNSNRNKTTLRMRDKYTKRDSNRWWKREGDRQLVYLALVALSFDFSHFDGQLSQQPGQTNKQMHGLWFNEMVVFW